MKRNGEKYYNFPAALMYGFWQSEEQKVKCLNDVINYCAYDAWCKKGRGGRVNEEDFNQFICKELDLTLFNNNVSKSGFYRMTAELREKYDPDTYKGLFFRISSSMCFDFYKNTKTAEERAGLLAYLATKSIIGQRPYAKTNKFFLTSRMACNSKTQNELPDEIEKYRLRYHFDKLKSALYVVYKVAIYSDKTMRGFYVSLKKDTDGNPDILWLAQQVEGIRKDRDEAKADPLKVALQNVRNELRKHNDTYTAPNEQREEHLKNST